MTTIRVGHLFPDYLNIDADRRQIRVRIIPGLLDESDD